jgi:hypothetical protein
VAPPRQARPRVAYDLGRRGEPLPDDWHDDPDLAGAYDMGVDDRDAASAGSDRRHDRPSDDSRRAEPDSSSGLAGEADAFSRRHPRKRTAAFSGPSDAAEGFRTNWRASGRGGGGGLLLGIIGYCIGRAFLTEGPHGIWRWYSAKFTNQIQPRGATTAPAQPTAPAAPVSRVVNA